MAELPQQTDIKSAAKATRWIFFLGGLCISSWAPMIPFAKERLQLNDAGLGLVLLAFGIGALLTMPLTGWLIHRFGIRKVVVTSSLLTFSCLPILALANSEIALSSCLFFFGTASGALNVSMNSHAVIVEKMNDKPIMSGLHCFFSLGGLFGAAILSFLLELGLTLFIGAAILALFMLTVAGMQFKNILKIAVEKKQQKVKSSFIVPRGNVWLLANLCFIAFLVEGAMLDWSAVFLTSSRAYNPSTAGFGYAAFSVAMALGRITGDKIIQRFGPIFVMQIGSLVAASGLFMIVFVPINYIELLGFAMVGLGASNIVPILFSASGRLPGIAPSLALTIVTTLGYTGILLGPTLIGFAASATSLSIALTGVGALVLVIAMRAAKISEVLYPKATIS